jgi:glycerophosphoryl diester phosphodiesterase
MTIRRNVLAGLMLALTTILPVAMPTDSLAAAPKQPMNQVLARLINEENGQRPQGGYVFHRGMFQPSAEGSTQLMNGIPENSLAAVARAKSYGAEMIEIDVRLSKNGTPYVVHDFALNRSTTVSRGTYKGSEFNIMLVEKWNVDKSGFHLPMPKSIMIQKTPDKVLNKAFLKAYSPGNKMTKGERLLTLRAFLAAVCTSIYEPLLILDLQDPQTTEAAANVIKDLGLQDRVILKFFAKTAVDDSKLSKFLDDGPKNTIAGWGNDLHYIIQFNDGQLTKYLSDDTNPARIVKYGKLWTPVQYADKFRATGRLVGVSLSKPVDSKNLDWAEKAVQVVADNYMYGSTTRLPLFGILINPDVGFRGKDKECYMYNFNANEDSDHRVSLRRFVRSDHDERRVFADSLDYIIADVMPYKDPGSYQTFIYYNYNQFEAKWC